MANTGSAAVLAVAPLRPFVGDVSGVAICGRPEAKELRSKPAGVADPLCPGVKPVPVSCVVYPDTAAVSAPGVPSRSGNEATCAVSTSKMQYQAQQIS
jgi:hypothetical protein